LPEAETHVEGIERFKRKREREDYEIAKNFWKMEKV